MHGRLTLNFITIKGKKSMGQSSTFSESEVILSLGYLRGDVTHGQTDLQPDD